MDNASKALIIAGAVLIAVMLVSVGVLIYNQAVGVIDTSRDQIAGMSISTFNNQFQQYLKNNATTAEVKSLLDAVINSNISSVDHVVKITSKNATGTNAGTLAAAGVKTTVSSTNDLQTISTELQKLKGHRYDITATRDSFGYYNVITISAHK